MRAKTKTKRHPYFRPREDGSGILQCPDCEAVFEPPTLSVARQMVGTGQFDSVEDALTKWPLRAAQTHWQTYHA